MTSELHRALDTELEPWHVTIVTAHAPVDATDAEAIALANDARYIVWRERDDLVVYDRELRLAARRKTRAGAFDKTIAASAAASVKTLMRLPRSIRQRRRHRFLGTPGSACGSISMRLRVALPARPKRALVRT